ncbi:MAG TPA: prolipoprotein diacylglyceryl transferase family protein [Thermoanaerobaculia bacterium]
MIYRTCLFTGVIGGVAASAFFATRAELTIPLWIATAALTICVSLLLAIATKVLLGYETFSFLHYQIAAIATVAIVVPIRGALDLLALALAITQSVGRIGCAGAGCCRGRRWRYGIFPVQILESALLAVIAIITATLIGRTGAAFAFYASAYAAVRFGLEMLRGDSRRHLFSLSEAQWICLGFALWQHNWILAAAMVACGAAIVIRGRAEAAR